MFLVIALLRIKLERPQSRIDDVYIGLLYLPAIRNNRLRGFCNKAEPVKTSRERSSIMLTSDATVEQQNTKSTVVVVFILSSPEVTREHSSIRETFCLCNSCYSTVTCNCRYVVFSSVTDCPLFAEALAIWDSPVIKFQTGKPANPQEPTTLKSYLK